MPLPRFRTCSIPRTKSLSTERTEFALQRRANSDREGLYQCSPLRSWSGGLGSSGLPARRRSSPLTGNWRTPCQAGQARSRSDLAASPALLPDATLYTLRLRFRRCSRYGLSDCAHSHSGHLAPKSGTPGSPFRQLEALFCPPPWVRRVIDLATTTCGLGFSITHPPRPS